MISFRILLVCVVFMFLYQQGTSQQVDFTNEADGFNEDVETPTKAPTGNRRVHLPRFRRFPRLNTESPVARPGYSRPTMLIETLSDGRVKCGTYICPRGSAGCRLQVATSPNGTEIIRTSTCLSQNKQVIIVDEQRSVNPNPSVTFSRTSYQLKSRHIQREPDIELS